MNGPRRLVILMARWPAAGRCKRRLAVGLGAVRAAVVQQRLQAHALAVLQQSGPQLGCEGWLALGGAGARAARRLLEPAGITLVSQGDGGLGVRMQRQLMRAFALGYGQVVLLGTDLPQLSCSDLQQAFAALDAGPAVLGPASDGGYWLLGLTRPVPALLSGIAWGSDQVLQQTCQRAKELALPISLLRVQADLDRAADLTLWR